MIILDFVVRFMGFQMVYHLFAYDLYFLRYEHLKLETHITTFEIIFFEIRS